MRRLTQRLCSVCFGGAERKLGGDYPFFNIEIWPAW